jgi:hypothetical protein
MPLANPAITRSAMDGLRVGSFTRTPAEDAEVPAATARNEEARSPSEEALLHLLRGRGVRV